MAANLFVDRGRFQFRFTFQFGRAVFIGICFASALFFLLTSRELGDKYNQVLLTLLELNRDILPTMLLTAIIALVATSLSVWMVALVKSNKIAGPVYRLENNIDAIGRGDLALKTGFRDGDAVRHLAEELNGTAEILNSKFSGIEENIREMAKEFRSLENGQSLSPGILLARVDGVKRALSYFKTDKCSVPGSDDED